jgi:DNA-binding CsgD family transcriptional regulator/catechol 2,3-dioxygenase-like lactoylglutathione lyase family enzyme
VSVNHNKSRRRGRPAYDDVLTPAEWKVTHAVQHGLSNRQVAERRGISPDGIKFHVANILGKLGLPNRQALRQWFRAPRGSALDHPGEHEMNGGFAGLGPIGQISRTVSDIQAAERWYGQVLGMKHLFTFGKLAFFDCGGLRLYLNEGTAPAGAESVLYFRVQDIKQSYKAMQDKGVEFTNAPHLIHRHPDGTEEWMAFFKDLEGRPLAIMEQVKGKP